MSKEIIDSIQVLYQDEYLLVVNKPAGLPSQPDSSGGLDLLQLLTGQTGLRNLYLIHRLDRPVGGLMIVARQPGIQETFTRQLTGQTLAKTYLAVVCGQPPTSQGELINRLAKNERLNISKVVQADHPKAKEAKLRWSCLASLSNPAVRQGAQGLSLLSVQLHTGRHHQIRVQLAHAGWPIWGDAKYNPAFIHAGGWNPLALVSHQLVFSHPVTHETLSFQLDWPRQVPFDLFAPASNSVIK